MLPNMVDFEFLCSIELGERYVTIIEILLII